MDLSEDYQPKPIDSYEEYVEVLELSYSMEQDNELNTEGEQFLDAIKQHLRNYERDVRLTDGAGDFNSELGYTPGDQSLEC